MLENNITRTGLKIVTNATKTFFLATKNSAVVATWIFLILSPVAVLPVLWLKLVNKSKLKDNHKYQKNTKMDTGGK